MKVLLTFNVVTEASAQHGDFARHGFVSRNKNIANRTYLPKRPAEFGLREAIDFLLSRKSEGPVEADSCPVSRACPPRWFSYGGKYSPDDCGHVTISLHLPRNVSPSSAMRVARILGCYGAK